MFQEHNPEDYFRDPDIIFLFECRGIELHRNSMNFTMVIYRYIYART